MKNILLGSVAGLAMVGTAAAADLPVKAKAAEYVKVCSTYGAGFYYIPGTDTCLKFGGYVQSDYMYQSYNYLPDEDYADSYFKLRGALRIDARTQTEYGTLRSFMEWRLQYGNADNGIGENSNSPNLKAAYIQFAGFTFGRVQSFFDFYADNNVWGIDSIALTSDYDATVAAYTADFGNGLTATISIEDDSSRSTGVDPLFYGQDLENDLPALVANLNYEGEWGGFQVSGMVRQLDTDYTGYPGGDDIGWAVLGGVKFNLPTLGEGDTLYIEGTYAQGAANYTGINGGLSNLDAVYDAYYNPISGEYEASKTWTIAGELTHYFTPQVFGVLYGNYGEADLPTNYVAPNSSIWNVGASLNWSPVKNLLFVAQYTYGETSYDNQVNGPQAVADDTNYNQVILSVRRTF